MGKTILCLLQSVKTDYDFRVETEMQALLGTIKTLNEEDINNSITARLQRSTTVKKTGSKRFKERDSIAAAYSSSEEKSLTTSSSTNSISGQSTTTSTSSIDPLLQYDFGALPQDPSQREEALAQILHDLKSYAKLLQRRERDLERREREIEMMASDKMTRSGSLKKH
jgi:hypothetical protein